MSTRRVQRSSSRWVHAAAFGPWLVLVGWAMFLAPLGSSGDSGVKLVQADALWQSGFTSRSLAGDAQLDPTGTHGPFGDPFIRVVDGESQGVYSVVFTALVAPTVGLFGLAGSPIVPLIGTLLIALGVMRMLRRLGANAAWIAVTSTVILLGTPVVLYSAELFEHTLATGLCAIALSFLVGGDRRMTGALFAGALVATAATVRAEAYCAVAAVGLAAVSLHYPSWRERARAAAAFLAGAVGVLAAYWLINVSTAGVWDPAVMTNQERSASLHGAFTLLVGELDGAKEWTWLVAATLPAALGMIPPSLLRGKAQLGARLGGVVVLIAICIFAQHYSTARVSSGLLVVTPVAMLGLVHGPWSNSTRALWVFSIVYLPLVLALDKSGTAGGLQLGSRYLLPAIPPLIVLAVELCRSTVVQLGARRSALIVVPVVVLLGLTGRGVYGQDALPKYLGILEDGNGAMAAVNRADEHIIVTKRFWESRVLAPSILTGRKIFVTQGVLGSVFVESLARAGVNRFVYVSNEPVDIPLQDGRRAHSVDSTRGWMNLQMVEIQ